MRTTVTFNDVDLGTYCQVSDLRSPLVPRTIGEEDVPARDGSVFTGVRLQPRNIKLRLTVKGRTIEERRAAAREVAAVLAVAEPKPLSLSIDEGLYWLAIPTSDGDVDIMTNHSGFDVVFRAVDPVAYGDEQAVTVPSGGSVSFNVGGTYAATPLVTAPYSITADEQYWRLALEDGRYLYCAPTWAGSARTGSISFDCGSHVMRVDGDVSMLAASADWLTLAPGPHTLTMTGAAAGGSATVTFRERWL